MTLRDKFKKCKDASNTYYVLPIADDAEQLEKIADDYAIEFTSFLRRQCLVDDQYIYWWYKGIKYTEKQLLEIFKKEKGL
jgi:hypothetical protein